MKKLKTHWTFKLEKRHMEQPTGKSLTVPDETMTIREILERHRRGMPLDPRNVTYSDAESFDDPDYSEMQRQDLFDLEMEKTRLSSEIERLQELRREAGEAREAQPKQTSEPTQEGSEKSEAQPNNAEPEK